jgi:hypothetical protein
MGTHYSAAATAAIAVVMSASNLMADEWGGDPAGNVFVPPFPEVSAKLFNPIDEATNPACPRMDEVISHYMLSATSLKSGKVKLLVGDLPQAFANVWRARLHMKPTSVSAVVAQEIARLTKLAGRRDESASG